MRVVYFDCPSGAAGDMIMAALVDAGAPLEALRAELRKLPLEGFDLVVRQVTKGAFRATKVDVEIDPHAHPQHRSLGDILGILEAILQEESELDDSQSSIRDTKERIEVAREILQRRK